MTMTTAPMNAERLLAMSDKEFSNLVNEDTRGRVSPEIAAALRSDQRVVRRWSLELQRAYRSIQGQLGAKDAEYKSQMAEALAARSRQEEQQRLVATYNRWRAGALRVKTGLEEKLIEARSLSDGAEERERVLTERNEALARIVELEAAIRKHREGMQDQEPSDEDLELWRFVP